MAFDSHDDNFQHYHVVGIRNLGHVGDECVAAEYVVSSLSSLLKKRVTARAVGKRASPGTMASGDSTTAGGAMPRSPSSSKLNRLREDDGSTHFVLVQDDGTTHWHGIDLDRHVDEYHKANVRASRACLRSPARLPDS